MEALGNRDGPCAEIPAFYRIYGSDYAYPRWPLGPLGVRQEGGVCGLISIFYGLVASAIAFLFSCISVDAGATADSILQFVLDIPSCIATFLLMRARLHDLDHTGWLSLLMFIPLVNILFVIYILFFRGTVGDNRYGRDPLLED